MILDIVMKNILILPRYIKRSLAVVNDLFLCIVTVWFSFYLRLGEFIPISINKYNGYDIITPIALSVLIAVPVFSLFGFYHNIFRHSGWVALANIVNASIVYFILYFVVISVWSFDGVPRTIGIIQPTLLFLTVGGSRAILQFWLSGQYNKFLRKRIRINVLIYGAGNAGRQLVAALHASDDFKVVGFLDDDDALQNSSINGVRVYSPCKIKNITANQNVQQIILALPSVSRIRRGEIIEKMSHLGIPIHTLPSISELAHGQFKISDIRELDLDDLLGRLQVDPNEELLKRDIFGKKIFISGAGGSIGKELSRQIFKCLPSVLLLIEQSEHALYSINQELVDLNKEEKTKIFPILCSITDEKKIQDILSLWKPNIIFHAAAYKHVPLVEHNPVVSIHNNVFGTLILAQAAEKYNIERFVLVSSDKAVRPTNIMGATKRLSEMILQAFAENDNKTIFTMVRFGNVLDSSGSVVPRFREQIKNGGPVTITHPEITRYFMTIPEAAQLVMQAGSMALGGEVFLLNMGNPVKILDLARRMIELSGLSVKCSSNPDGDIDIKIIGLRPGEKLYEELLIGNDTTKTEHALIMKSRESYLDRNTLLSELNNLQTAMDNNNIHVIHVILKRLIEGYNPVDGIVDWMSIDHKFDENPKKAMF